MPQGYQGTRIRPRHGRRPRYPHCSDDKATPGTPVSFSPGHVPASGSVINVTLRYQRDGKLVTVRGQDWIEDMKTNKPMDHEWVFGGSRFIETPRTRTSKSTSPDRETPSAFATWNRR